MIGSKYLDLKHPQKLFSKLSVTKIKALGKQKSFQNLLYNKEIYFILQSSNAKYKKHFKLIHIYIYIYIYIYNIYIYIYRERERERERESVIIT